MSDHFTSFRPDADQGGRCLESVAVYCGSSPGRGIDYIRAAADTGAELARRGIRLVYGGGGVGLMGAVADGALAAGGRVTGVIPEFLDTRELKHPGVADMRVTRSMHERKLIMVEESQAFMALPGGYGTLDELFEVLTWAQLRIHPNPVGLLNVNGFFQPLLDFLERQVKEGFLTEEDRNRVLTDSDPGRLLDALEAWTPPPDTKFALARRVEI
jgi:uncharacterized protein (TIGR00730 family)